MSYDHEFDDLLTEAITYEAYVSEDAYRAANYSPTPKTVKGRIEQVSRLVRDQSGREVVSNTRLYLKPVADDGTAITPTVKDRYTLPAGYDPPQPPPISVARANDGDGLHHWEISL